MAGFFVFGFVRTSKDLLWFRCGYQHIYRNCRNSTHVCVWGCVWLFAFSNKTSKFFKKLWCWGGVGGGSIRKFDFINWVDNVTTWLPFLRLFSKADVSRWSRSSVFMVVQGFFSTPVMSAKNLLTGYLSKMGKGFPCERITISPKRISSVRYVTRVIYFAAVRFECVSRTTRSHFWRYGNFPIRMGCFSFKMTS